MHWFTRTKTRPVLAPASGATEAEVPAAADAESSTNATTPPRSRRRLFGLLKVTGLGIATAGGASVLLQQNAGTAYAGSTGVFSSNVSSTPAVLATGTNGARGVTGSSDTGYGVTGVSTSSVGLRGASTSGSGVYGTSVSTTGTQAGVYGQDSSGSANGMGTYGTSVNGYGVHGKSTNGIGVYGTSSSDHGVYGDTTGTGAAGVFGQDDSSTIYSFGVYANSTNGTGLYANGSTGVYAYSTNGTGLYANGGTGTAALFDGTVNVTGTLSKGGGSFLIDHPLDPANKSLYHSFVESPDMKNIYDGVVTLDANGEAVVPLPDWFGTLNRDFCYQLTCLGGYAPVYIASEIAHKQFTIAEGQANMKVSWQVTGIRQDAWANKHRIPVEEMKTGTDKGKYHHPELFGAPKEQGISYRPVSATPHTPGKQA
jgi:hypothetical protein